MNVFLVNDDGIDSLGIRKLAGALGEQEGVSIYVCAPSTQQSTKSHSLNLTDELSAEEVEFPGANFALSISGTPADCVKLGLYILEGKGISIDMLFSGINLGSNLGTDTLYSGTVAAAVEGSFNHIPSVAVSVDSHEAKHFECACRLAANSLRRCYGRLDYSTIININTPDLPENEIKGVRYARLGERKYSEKFKKLESDGKTGYRYRTTLVHSESDEGTDVVAARNGYATITPLQWYLTDCGMIEEVKKWRLDE